MEVSKFKETARVIVTRNVTVHVKRVLANFNSKRGDLRLIYCTAGAPDEDDLEYCEIACAELIAAFPEIRTAQTKCIRVEEYTSQGDEDEVFSGI